MKIIITIILFFVSTFCFSQTNSDCKEEIIEDPSANLVRKKCPESGADTLFVYDDKNNLKAYYDYGTNADSDGTVIYCKYNQKFLDPLKKITGHFTADGKKTGEWKYFKKNDRLWDFVIYENDKKTKWIRYSKQGEILWEKEY